MPAYDFRCVNCGSTCEVVRPAADRSAIACPDCGGETKRVFTPVGVVFKGTGFHNTDYKNKNKGNGNGDTKKADDTPACPAADAGSSKCAGCPSAAGD